MPVIRGSLRPSGDGSIKSFIVILTVIGFLCFIYYKMKISPGCAVFMAEINSQRAEINRLASLVKNFDEIIQNLKEDNKKVVAQKEAKDKDLDAARTSESDGLKQIAQLKKDLEAAESKLENCGPADNLGMSYVDIEEKYKQEIMDLKAMILQLKSDSKSKHRYDTKYDSDKEAPEYPQKGSMPFSHKVTVPSEVDENRNIAKGERNELLHTVEFTSSNASKGKIHKDFEETPKSTKMEVSQDTNEERDEDINASQLKGHKAKESQLMDKELNNNLQDDPAAPYGKLGKLKRHTEPRNDFQKLAGGDRQIEGKGQDAQKILGKDQQDSEKDKNQYLKERPKYGGDVEGFKYGHEKDEMRLGKHQDIVDHSQNPWYHIKQIKRKTQDDRSIIETDSTKGHDRLENDRHEVGREPDGYDNSQIKLKNEQIRSIPDAWHLPGQNESELP